MRFSQFLKTFRITSGGLLAELMGGIMAPGPLAGALVTVTYSASMTPNASAGTDFIITATNNTAFAINAPTGTPPSGYAQTIRITVRNTSGGALGAATFNAVFKLGAAWTQPANGFSRTIEFRWNGTNWVEIGRTAADVAN